MAFGVHRTPSIGRHPRLSLFYRISLGRVPAAPSNEAATGSAVAGAFPPKVSCVNTLITSRILTAALHARATTSSSVCVMVAEGYLPTNGSSPLGQ